MDEVSAWLDEWWFIASSWLHDPEPLSGPKWDSLAYRAAVLPDEADGVDIRPMKRLLRAMVAWGAPSPISGPRMSPDRLQETAAEAWSSYQRLHRLSASKQTIEQTNRGTTEGTKNSESGDRRQF